MQKREKTAVLRQTTLKNNCKKEDDFGECKLSPYCFASCDTQSATPLFLPWPCAIHRKAICEQHIMVNSKVGVFLLQPRGMFFLEPLKSHSTFLLKSREKTWKHSYKYI